MNFTTYCTFALMALSLCLLVLAWQVNVSYITMFCAGSGRNSLFPVGRGGGAKTPKFPTKPSNFIALEKVVFIPLLI